jgi:multidrug efflux system membrane fusion protein
MSRIVYSLIAILALASCEKPVPKQLPPHLVSTVKPHIADVPLYVDYTGHLVAKTTVSVRSQVSGELVAQYFEEGQTVKKGDLLLVIDPRPYEAALAQAKGALHETIASLNYAKETAERYGPLLKQEFISQLSYDQYVTNVLVDEALLEQNKAQIETAQINLGYCFIEAPMDCVTGKLYVKTGNYVDASANTELTVLNQIQPILVDFYVPETDLFTIQERAKKSPIELIVYPEPTHKRSFKGTLTLINNQINTSTGSVLLEGTLPNEEGLLWAGHFVDVRLILENKKGALLLPTDAVMIGQKGHYVFVVGSDSTVAVKNVKIGQRYDDKNILIESGLEPTDQVVTEGQLNLYPGMKVEISNESL